MKKLLFCLLVGLSSVSFAQNWNYQNRNPLWTMVVYSGLKPSELKAQFPNLPVAADADEQSYTKAFTKWMFDHPDEWKQWEAHPLMRKNNLGWVYAYTGKSVPESLDRDGLAQFVKALKLSEARLSQLAPDFPVPTTPKAVQDWLEKYPLQFEALARCPEAQSMHPSMRLSFGMPPGITAQSYRLLTTMKPDHERMDSTEANKTQILVPSSPANFMQPE